MLHRDKSLVVDFIFAFRVMYDVHRAELFALAAANLLAVLLSMRDTFLRTFHYQSIPRARSSRPPEILINFSKPTP